MSLILDALNRARQEEESVPGIATEHLTTASTSSNVRRYLPWAALSLALLVIAWLVVDRGKIAPVAQPENAVASSSEQSVALAGVSDNLGSAVSSVRSELQARAAAASQSDPAGNHSVGANESLGAAESASSPASVQTRVAVDGLASSSQAQAVTEHDAMATSSIPVAAAKEPLPERTQRDDSAVQAIYQAQADALYAQQASVDSRSVQAAAQAPSTVTDSAPPAIREDPVDIERMLLKAREEMKDARLVEHSAPFLATLSQQTKDEIPTILYQRHDYSADGSRSTVVLNGGSLQVGAETRGVKVEEILPESVVLNHRGVVFRLRALNSWVNL